MTTYKSAYPADSVAITLTAASLASDSGLVIGRASTAVDNSTNLDLDHLISALIITGSSPTADSYIELWAYAMRKTVSGTPTYPESITGTDASKTFASLLTKTAAMRNVATIQINGTSAQPYEVAPTSLRDLFGVMPRFYGLFLVHSTGVNLAASGHEFWYTRSQLSGV